MRETGTENPRKGFRTLKVVNFFFKLFYRVRIFLKRSPLPYSSLNFLLFRKL